MMLRNVARVLVSHGIKGLIIWRAYLLGIFTGVMLMAAWVVACLYASQVAVNLIAKTGML